MRLLDLLGLDPALAGDLLEERRRGRSLVWYWRQILIAISVAIWRAIFDHKLLALRAVGTGCVVNAVWTVLWMNFLHIGLPSMPRLSMESLASLLLLLLTQVATGWIVARTHRPYAIPMVVVFASYLVIAYVGANFAEGRRLLVDSLDQQRFRPYFAWYLTPTFVEIFGLLLGGLAGAGAKPRRLRA